MAGTLEIQVNAIGLDGESIDITGNGELVTFKPTRNTNKRASITTDVPTQVKALHDAIFADYNLGQYTMSYSETSVFIEHEDSAHFDGRTSGASNITYILTTVANKKQVTLNTTYSPSTVPSCSSVGVTLDFTVTPSGTVEKLNIFRVISGNLFTIYFNETHNSNTLSFDVDREAYQYTRVVAEIGTSVYTFDITPPEEVLSIENINVVSSPFSSIVTINTNIFLGSDESEYSITQGSAVPEFQNSNVISGITEGDYTAHVRDKYDCVKIKPFNVLQGGNYLQNNKMFVSQLNSIYFAEREEGVLGNVKSFLSHDDPNLVNADDFHQVFSDQQVSRNQFKSNYRNHRVTVSRICETKALADSFLNVTKTTDNINRDSYLEGTITRGVKGAILISFTPGDIYNENGSVIGQHEYNGVLPSFYNGGVFVRIQGFDGQIIETFEEGGIVYARTSITEASIVLSINENIHTVHQALDYEVFEFSFSMSGFSGTEVVVKIEAFDNDNFENPERTFVSEKIKIIPHSELINGNYHICEFYSESTDHEIDYSFSVNTKRSRIRHLRNIPYYAGLKPISGGEVETELLDNVDVKIDSESRELFETRLKKLPNLFAASLLRLYDKSEFIIKDGLTYTTVSNANMEGDFQYSTVKAQLSLTLNNEDRVNNNSINNIIGFYPVTPS